jgi:Flp pilus assembly pilin Flp
MTDSVCLQTPQDAAGTMRRSDSKRVARRLRRGQRGQGLTEYGLVLMLIAIVVLVALQFLGGTEANTLYDNISTGLRTATGG